MSHPLTAQSRTAVLPALSVGLSGALRWKLDWSAQRPNKVTMSLSYLTQDADELQLDGV